ncbi:class I SAM-dependent methyltransferase [Labedella phragmitis]|uniref:Class I SAM-dependent methyltransferase n=1 Tax=Labedella phragmitis TaxID=2498849 RepID=A0A3S3Z180_9MICO|nr:class I SAM-dependent methyltransferase [Labedella phragmitis]RWZ49523.1 class I SAM-dependent methyltransferase [Labedella phragmitis]
MQFSPSAVAWTNAEHYEPYIGRWSRLVAPSFVDWIDVPPEARWLETGCGTGALTSSILEHARPSSVLATDTSQHYLDHARRLEHDPVVDFRLESAEHVGLPDASVDVAVSALVLNVLADPAVALAESRRVTRSGGTVGAYVWDYSYPLSAIRIFWDTAILLDPIARRLHEGRRFASWSASELARRFRGSGFADVELVDIEIETTFADFSDYWEPMLGGQGPAPTYIASLEPGAVDTLRSAVYRQLPFEDDGSIRLRSRAFAVQSLVR